MSKSNYGKYYYNINKLTLLGEYIGNVPSAKSPCLVTMEMITTMILSAPTPQWIM